MAAFNYVAETEQGNRTPGTVEAADAQAAQARVEAMFEGPIKVTITASDAAQASVTINDDLSFPNESCAG